MFTHPSFLHVVTLDRVKHIRGVLAQPLLPFSRKSASMMNRPRSYSFIMLLLLLTVLFAQPVLADGAASRGPALPNGDTENGSISGGGIFELNPMSDVVNTDAGYDSVTSVRLDTDFGTIEGYAEFDLDQDITVPADTPLGSVSQGTLILDAIVVLVDDAPSDTMGDMVVEFEFDGVFDVVDQMPSLLLTADIAVTQITGFFPPAGTIFQSLLSYSLSKATPVYEVIPSELGVQAPLFGGGSTPFPGASSDIISIAPNALEGIVRLTIPVENGDQILVTALLNGIATAEPSSMPPGETVTVLTSAGIVDFSSPGILSISMPEGLTLQGVDPLIPNVVPEPSAAHLILFGTAGLLGLARRRR